MDEVDGSFPAFLDRVLEFPDGKSYELLEPLTDFRACHDGTPLEARIVFVCRQVSLSSGQQSKNEFVMKVKVQVPGESPNSRQKPETGPSTTTSAEIKALERFHEANSPDAPHLVTWKQAIQGPNGLLPGGYLTFTVMTKMPGQTLLNLQYWEMTAEEREEVVREFLQALRSIYTLGIQPIDRALRNVIWDRVTKRCSSVIDFELWQETTETVADETKELQRWGLARRPPPRSWWDEWSFHTR